MAQADSLSTPVCPTCGAPLLYLGAYLPRDGVDRVSEEERTNAVTHIYRCPDHRLFRLGPDGVLTAGG
jgi:hypothetical protein